MGERDEKTLNLLLIILFYEGVKFVLNTFIGGIDIGAAIFTAMAAFILIKRFPKYGNYIVAIGLAAIALHHLPGHLSSFFAKNWKSGIYLLEAIGDIGFAVLLFAHKGIRAHFAQTDT